MIISDKTKEHYIMCWTLLSYIIEKNPEVMEQAFLDAVNGKIILKELKEEE